MTVECPALVIRAGVNPILNPFDAEKMVNLNPLIQLVVIPDSTHNVHGSQSEAYFRAVTEFLARPFDRSLPASRVS